MHTNSLLLYQRHVLPRLNPGQRLLEIGPDAFPASSFRQATPSAPHVWETLDIHENEALTFRATNDYAFPITDASYDVVFSAQVLEHVRKPWLWMKEVARVCRPGGLVITINPISWPYHEAPVDCWRIYPEGHRALADEAGLTVELAVFESLELGDYRRKRFGRSIDKSKPGKVAWKKRLGLKIECALDTVCIARK